MLPIRKVLASSYTKLLSEMDLIEMHIISHNKFSSRIAPWFWDPGSKNIRLAVRPAPPGYKVAAKISDFT